MPLIQCLLGQTVQTVAGQNYSFDRDRFGRYVALVHNADHAKVFLAVTHYQAVDDEAVPAQPEQAAAAEPKAGEGAKKPRGRKKAEPKVDPLAAGAAGGVGADAGVAGNAAQEQGNDPAPAQEQAPAQPEQAAAAGTE